MGRASAPNTVDFICSNGPTVVVDKETLRVHSVFLRELLDDGKGDVFDVDETEKELNLLIEVLDDPKLQLDVFSLAFASKLFAHKSAAAVNLLDGVKEKGEIKFGDDQCSEEGKYYLVRGSRVGTRARASKFWTSA